MYMHEQREAFFRCTFLSKSTRRTAHVRAWDVGEAVKLFRTELQTEGVDERGTMEVSDFGGSETQRANYRPLLDPPPALPSPSPRRRRSLKPVLPAHD